jgi:1,4-alpha-glucan branching enzyme
MPKTRKPPKMAPPAQTKVVFALYAPDAADVLVAGSFCDWSLRSVRLKRDRTGTWKATVPLSPGRYEYRFIVDGEWRDDPNCPDRAANPFGTQNCVLDVMA